VTDMCFPECLYKQLKKNSTKAIFIELLSKGKRHHSIGTLWDFSPSPSPSMQRVVGSMWADHRATEICCISNFHVTYDRASRRREKKMKEK
jgi:hypothetical protein